MDNQIGGNPIAGGALLPFIASKTRRAQFVSRTQQARALTNVEGLLAGAAEVDITPPPGMPKAGYSANAHRGSGFRTRLRARVLHLRSAESSLAIVQCDLLGGSSVVHHLVAEAVAGRTDVSLAGLFMGATHTHAGPGQYLGSDFYNQWASNRSGFDPAFTHWLVERITIAVIEAVDTRRPARLAIGTTDVWGLTRNRSLDAHVRNESVDDTTTPAQRKFVAINPALHLLRVDTTEQAGKSLPLAAMVVFSVHGTGISMKAHEYNADIWAYLVGELAHRIEDTTGTRPVVGAIEGTHADVAPAIRPGMAGHLESARVGRAIGAEAASLHHALAGKLSDSVNLAAGLREVDLDENRSIDGIELPRRPAVGAALVGGAHENVTPVVHRIPPFGPGWGKPAKSSNPHGAKWVLGSRWLQPISLRLSKFPRVLPVQVLRIGDTMLVGLPFEVTVESGRRVEQEVALAVDAHDIERIIVSSVANEYAGYVATSEEYGLQNYEGAHTLYGPTTQPFLAAHSARLAGEVAKETIVLDVPPERSWNLKVHRHLPAADGIRVDRSFVSEARFTDPTAHRDGYWEIEWRDVAPPDLHWHEPLVRVEARDVAGDEWSSATRDDRIVDDSGWDLQVTYCGHESGGHRYAALWWDPSFKGGRQYRFVLIANNGQPEIASQAFQ